MKTLNNLRAKLIYSEYEDGDCSIVATDVMRRYMVNCPSIIERGTCKQKRCAPANTDINSTVIGLNEIEFATNMKNLEKAIVANFPSEQLCRKCHQPFDTFHRTFGNHLLIEVFLHGSS